MDAYSHVAKLCLWSMKFTFCEKKIDKFMKFVAHKIFVPYGTWQPTMHLINDQVSIIALLAFKYAYLVSSHDHCPNTMI